MVHQPVHHLHQDFLVVVILEEYFQLQPQFLKDRYQKYYYHHHHQIHQVFRHEIEIHHHHHPWK
jgi:hypothetical protein